MSEVDTGKDILLDAVRAQADRVAALVVSLPGEAWAQGDVEQWGPPQHLAHLVGSHERTAQGERKARLPRHKRGVSRSYDEVKNTYLNALATTPAEVLRPNPVRPDVPRDWTREDALTAFQTSLETLTAATTRWSESDLDTLALPHPLMGLLSARELLHFTAYHTEHHRTGIERWNEKEKDG